MKPARLNPVVRSLKSRIPVGQDTPFPGPALLTELFVVHHVHPPPDRVRVQAVQSPPYLRIRAGVHRSGLGQYLVPVQARHYLLYFDVVQEAVYRNQAVQEPVHEALGYLLRVPDGLPAPRKLSLLRHLRPPPETGPEAISAPRVPVPCSSALCRRGP